VVLKFGGTSVAEPDNWPRIAAILRARLAEGLRPVLVHSALAGVSDLLDRVGEAALAGEHGGLIGRIAERHRALLQALALPEPVPLASLFDELVRLAAGVSLVGEATPRLRARIMALGELMASRIAVACLERAGLRVVHEDARDVLRSRPLHPTHDARHYLSAVCAAEPDPALQARWRDAGDVVVTQGFIASDDRGQTVLLGRGGSDTSAAYLAARLQAARLEIWTDVPGMFSANPRAIPSARLLRRLSFDEAQEIAATGAKVLHPRCLPVARGAGIDVHVHSTRHPDLAGTVVSDAAGAGSPRIKAVSARSGLVLVSMESLGMWQEPGFLARAFQAFSDLGLSVDLVSTSESVVSVTLDGSAAQLDESVLDELVARLQALCRVRLVRPCAAVSVVGTRMRANLHRLAPALEAFEEHEIYLVSQAASDLNFTVVIEEGQVDRLVRTLHEQVIAGGEHEDALGPSWEQLFARPAAATEARGPWWRSARSRLLAVAAEQAAAYVYDRATLARTAGALRAMRAVDRVLYAVKANPHPEILRAFAAAGLGFECVSPGELRAVFEALPGIERGRVLFTPNFAPPAEYREALAAGVQVTLDNLHPLRRWPEIFAGRRLFARVDLGEGRGHHGHVRTEGVRSKFGIPQEEIDELAELCARHRVELGGLHAHGGSGIRDSGHWRRVADELAAVAARFPQVRVLDLGGGLGVPEKPGDAELDLAALDASLAEARAAAPDRELWLEPGRYLVSEAGVLLATVTQTKGKGGARYVGVTTGMNSLIRPALYGAYHAIVNLTRLDEPATELVTVVGPICESGDRLGRDRLLPPCREGDVLLVANAGAYGHAMSSRYNLREPAVEVVL
jgi:diaminopimelate decarboxylase/aspartate kinase